jgi:acyl-CoA reductase-like NAD-dependent aldehyde dehydrogenase
MESGKPSQTAAMEVSMTVGFLRESSTIRIENEVIEDTDERRAYVRYVPLGVGAAIVPWNWPLILAVGKLGPGLMTGNTIIMKPSPFTPYIGLKLGELGAKIFPPGVFQVLSGGDDLGPMLTEHPDIDKIAFTGSTATGMKVMKSAASTLKRITLELGGNDAAIICEDVDLDKVVPKATHFLLYRVRNSNKA